MRYFPYCLLGQVGVATDGDCASFGSFLPSFKGWVPERNMADLFAALCAPQKATGGGSRPPQNTVWDCAQCSNGRSKTSAEVQVWINLSLFCLLVWALQSPCISYDLNCWRSNFPIFPRYCNSRPNSWCHQKMGTEDLGHRWRFVTSMLVLVARKYLHLKSE